jgi:hypothetical protein
MHFPCASHHFDCLGFPQRLSTTDDVTFGVAITGIGIGLESLTNICVPDDGWTATCCVALAAAASAFAIFALATAVSAFIRAMVASWSALGLVLTTVVVATGLTSGAPLVFATFTVGPDSPHFLQSFNILFTSLYS